MTLPTFRSTIAVPYFGWEVASWVIPVVQVAIAVVGIATTTLGARRNFVPQPHDEASGSAKGHKELRGIYRAHHGRGRGHGHS